MVPSFLANWSVIRTPQNYISDTRKNLSLRLPNLFIHITHVGIYYIGLNKIPIVWYDTEVDYKNEFSAISNARLRIAYS